MSATASAHPDANAARSAAASSFGGHRGVVEGLRDLAARATPGVLAVVVETGGSTYRKPGALILLDDAGVRVGALSGGCLEGELEAAARAVLASGVVADVRFDTSGDEDRVFGSGTGCGGSTRVLLLPLPATGSPLRDALLDADARGLPLALRLSLAADTLGAGDAKVGSRRVDTRLWRFDTRGAATSVAVDAGSAPIALGVPAPLRLLLLGAGPETRPLLLLTRLLGWRVELVEHRERWLRFADGCGIDRVHRDGADALAALLTSTAFDATLVMNHNYHLDARSLAALAETQIPYVGLLGPAARRDDLLREIGGSFAAQLRPRLRAPVGLPLGGEGAEAIALAIVAQVQNQLSRSAYGD